MRLLNLKVKPLIIILLIPILLLSGLNESSARKKRTSSRASSTKYNPRAARAQAIDIIKNSSATVSELAGIESNVENAQQFNIDNDGEDLSDNFELGDLGEDVAELEQEDDVAINIDDLKTLWLQFVTGNDEKTDYGMKKTVIMDKIMDWLGTPYKFGGTSNKAIDCSGWTQRIFIECADILLPRTAREQVTVGRKITFNNLEFGDLIFFHTYSRKFASHVGIYLGDNLFAHASSRFGVTVSSLQSTYYKNRFIGGRRLSRQDIGKLSMNKSKKQNGE